MIERFLYYVLSVIVGLVLVSCQSNEPAELQFKVEDSPDAFSAGMAPPDSFASLYRDTIFLTDSILQDVFLVYKKKDLVFVGENSSTLRLKEGGVNLISISECRNLTFIGLTFEGGKFEPRNTDNIQNDLSDPDGNAVIRVSDSRGINFKSCEILNGLNAIQLDDRSSVTFDSCLFKNQWGDILSGVELGKLGAIGGLILRGNKFKETSAGRMQYLIGKYSKVHYSSRNSEVPLIRLSKPSEPMFEVDSNYILKNVSSGIVDFQFKEADGEPESIYGLSGGFEVEFLIYGINEDDRPLLREGEVYRIHWQQSIINLEPYETGYVNAYLVTKIEKIK